MATRTYYVTVIDPESGRKGFLLGPYRTQTEALHNVRRGKELAHQHDYKAAWYGYGTAGAPVEAAPIKTVFGI